jgi:alkylated DNA repair dioxygenase AlkB
MQLALLGRERASFDATFSDARHVDLGSGAWIDYAQSFVRGHAVLFERLLAGVKWQETTQQLYDKRVVTPRLVASREDMTAAEPLLDEIAAALSKKYAIMFDRMTFALYRDGTDSVAWHRDRVLRRQQQGIVATVSLGEPRTFLVRPYRGGTPSRRYHLGWGDLLIMGGTCQVSHEHAVPKVRHVDGPRIAVMFRHAARLA